MKSFIIILLASVFLSGFVFVGVHNNIERRDLQIAASTYLVEQREGEANWRAYYCKDITIRPDGWIEIVEWNGNKMTLTGQIRVKKLK